MVQRWFGTLVFANVLTMLLQAGFAGSMLGGNSHAVSLHELTAKVLVIVATVQVAILVILRRRWAYPRWLLLSSVGLVVAEVLEFSLGHYGEVAVHVPLGLAIFGGVVRQMVWALQPGQVVRK